MRKATLAPLLLAGCWSVDRPYLPDATYPFEPPVGAPEGWSVHRLDTSLLCPSGTPAPLFFVTPDAQDPAVDPAAPFVPLALIFISGAFDYMPSTADAAPLSGTSWQASQGLGDRLTAAWGADRGYELLGLRDNTDPVEHHDGNLPAALAEKGIASLIVPNCWGDLWHNRSSLVENDYASDLFYREGRTLAEFAWYYAHEPFPPANPATLPIKVDQNRIYMIGLGDGSRAIAELLSLRDTSGAFLYDADAVVVDSPEDDLRPYFDPARGADLHVIGVRTGLSRIYAKSAASETLSGSLLQTPAANLPPRIGFIFPSGDGTLIDGANDALLARIPSLHGIDVWRYSPAANAHVLSNADPGLAKSVANFLVRGSAGVDPAYLTP